MSIIQTLSKLTLAAKIGIVVVVVGGGFAVSRVIPKSVPKVAGATSPTSSGFSFSNLIPGGGPAPIHVCVNTWGGFAGAQWYNGGFKASKDSHFYKDQGIQVEFLKMDDFDQTRNAWKTGACDLAWATVDEMPTEAEGLADNKPRFYFQIDLSRGGDLILAVRTIHTLNDLKGKKVGVAFGTPSHSLLLWMLNISGMNQKDITIVQMKGEPDVVAAMKAGALDAGVMWSPDDSDVMAAVPGTHVLVSTKQATDIIADTMWVSADFLQNHRDDATKLYRGWMIGNATVNTNSQAFDEAVAITAAGYGMPPEFMATAIHNTRLVTHGDNRNFFGLNPAYRGMTASDLYTKTGMLYQESGLVSGFPSFRNIVDTSIIASVTDLNTDPSQQAEVVHSFAQPTAAVVNAAAISAKPVTVTFPTGSDVLDSHNQDVIDKAVVNMLREFKTSYIRIEGNTDATGPANRNVDLSFRRAESVRSYLVMTYQIDANRLVSVGNGANKPACVESSSADVDACRAQNRRTEFQVLNTNQQASN